MTNPLFDKIMSAITLLDGAREATAASRQHRRPSKMALRKLGLHD